MVDIYDKFNTITEIKKGIADYLNKLPIYPNLNEDFGFEIDEESQPLFKTFELFKNFPFLGEILQNEKNTAISTIFDPETEDENGNDSAHEKEEKKAEPDRSVVCYCPRFP